MTERRLMEKLDEALDLKNLAFPERPKVAKLVYWPKIDSIGDPAVQIEVVIDEFREGELKWRRLEPIEDEIKRALEDADIDRYPYFSYMTVAERADLEAQR